MGGIYEKQLLYERKEKKKQNGLRLWSRGKKAILINLSRRFFLPFVIHKEGKKPLIFLPISRSNFSNTRIPPLNPLFELIQRIELVFCWYTTWFICQWSRGRIISAKFGCGCRGQNRIKGNRDEEDDGHPVSKILSPISGNWGSPDIRKSLRRETILVRF